MESRRSCSFLTTTVKAWVLCLALVLPSTAQDTPQTHTLSDFSAGLNTWKKGIYLKDSESPDLQNVILDKNGGISSRPGYRRLNFSAIGGGSTEVNASYQLETTNGTKYCVSFSSTSGLYSTDGCATFTSFVSTLTRLNDVNCVALQDRLNCVNNQYNFYFNGTNDVPISAMPAACDHIMAHRNRCWVSGCTGNLSRVYYSNLGDCTAWTTGTDYIDVSPDDGDTVLAIGPPVYDMLPVYKKFSTWAIKRFSTPFELINISRTTGAKNHRSVANFKNVQLFDSLGPNGGEPGIYSFNGIVVQEASENLRNEIEDIDTFHSNAGHYLIDDKPAWDLGKFSTYTMSSSRISGFMTSTYTAFTDTLKADFGAGTHVNSSSVSITNSLTITQPSSATFINAGAESNSTSINWSAQPWAVTANSAAPLPLVGTLYGTYHWAGGNGANGICNDQVEVRILNTSSETLKLMYHELFDQQTATEYTIDTSTLPVQMIKLYVKAAAQGSYAEAYSFPFIRPQNIKIVLGDTANNSADCALGWDVDETTSYISSANFTSQHFDMAINTPVFGTFEAAITSSSLAGLTFQTQTATSTNGTWQAVQTGTLGSEIVSDNRRFVRYLANFTVNSATNTPAIVSSVTVSAASTGTWTSQEFFLSNNISATGWGLFQTVQTVSGSEASIAYAIRVSSFSGGTANTAYTSISPGDTISVSTGAYMQIISTFTVGVGTEAARLDTILINWTEGSQATSPSAVVCDGRYHYGAQSKDGSRNDVMYVLDSQGAWVKWTGVRPRHLSVVNQACVMSDSQTSSTGFIYKLYDTDADDGAAIDSYWESKDLNLSGLHKIKAIDRIYTVHSSSQTTVTMTLKSDGGLSSDSFDLDFSTGASFGIKPQVVEPAINGNTFRIRYGSNAISKPWEVLGILMYYRDLGLMQ